MGVDQLFGEKNFLNEIVWHYRKWSTDIKAFQRNHDTIFWYNKKANASSRHFEVVAHEPPSEGTLKRWKGKKQKAIFDSKGNRLATDTQEESAGAPISDVWKDIEIEDVLEVSIINPAAVERIGYPTQKPEALLDRIIRATTKPGDLVLDSFAGSGTTCAVAEKLNRRWIGIDCGKLAIYTIQKRMLNLKSDIGNKGKPHKAKPFTLYNAGLYDFSRLKELPWNEWRRFALTLFGCTDKEHIIGGIRFDGTLKSCPVQVFDHRQHEGAAVTEETLHSIHEAVGSKIGSRMFIIAPSLAFDFQQDYIQLGDVRYYALRIPYSIIHELHQREFMALKQPVDEMDVNNTVDAVGFDFIRTPDLEYSVGQSSREGEFLSDAFIKIEKFFSEAAVRDAEKKHGNRDTLSMVMLDYNYDIESDVFDLDEVFYAGDIEEKGWRVSFPIDKLIGKKVMAVFVDIYGNEARIVIPTESFTGNEASTKRSNKKVKNKPQKIMAKSIKAKRKISKKNSGRKRK